jgi:hypothetical protein
MADPARDPHAGDGAWMHLANEFAEVRVRRVHTRNGVRLEIVAPKLDRAILLDPVELESLTWQTPETFSSFLTQPFGPEPEVE